VAQIPYQAYGQLRQEQDMLLDGGSLFPFLECRSIFQELQQQYQRHALNLLAEGLLEHHHIGTAKKTILLDNILLEQLYVVYIKRKFKFLGMSMHINSI
jgi:hypothetical protein